MPSLDPEPQWRPTNAPLASSRTDDIWFLDPPIGWAVNSNGQILMTADGGVTWQEQFHSPAYLRCVGFANRSKGWVGTLSVAKRLYQTRDGGTTTWAEVTNLPAVAPAAICGMSVVNEFVIYASGTNFPNQPARMIKSVDGGEIWTGWEMSEHATLLVDTFFTSPERGYRPLYQPLPVFRQPRHWRVCFRSHRFQVLYRTGSAYRARFDAAHKTKIGGNTLAS